MRRSNLIARMGNVVMTIVGFIVKSISSKWAYRYTSYNNPHAEKFLMGVKKEVKLINELAKNPNKLEDVKNHVWSYETRLDVLQWTKNEDLMKIFVKLMRTANEWDAAMSNKEFRTLAYECKAYTLTAQQTKRRALVMPDEEWPLFVRNHNTEFTSWVLAHMGEYNNFLKTAVELETVKAEQVEFFLKFAHKTELMKEFIKKFFLAMPATAENTEILEREFPELMKKWVTKQNSNTLCECCLERWAAKSYEQGLRIIEEKCIAEGRIGAAERLVRSTRMLYFNDAINLLIKQDMAKTDLLYYVQEKSVHYYKLVDELLKNPSRLKDITESQLSNFRDDQKRKYWLKMAESGNLTAEKLKKVPEELKEKVLSILEENSMIAWLESHSPVNKRDLEFIATKTITPRVQSAMAKKKVDERWIYTIFSGNLYATFMKSRYGDDLNFSISRSAQLLSSEAFRILVDDNRREVLEDYFRAMPDIPAVDREYLLCSPLKDMAVGVGTIS